MHDIFSFQLHYPWFVNSELLMFPKEMSSLQCSFKSNRSSQYLAKSHIFCSVDIHNLSFTFSDRYRGLHYASIKTNPSSFIWSGHGGQNQSRGSRKIQVWKWVFSKLLSPKNRLCLWGLSACQCVVMMIKENLMFSDYDDQDGVTSRGKPPKKPARKPSGQKRKFASKLLPKEASRWAIWCDKFDVKE